MGIWEDQKRSIQRGLLLRPWAHPPAPPPWAPVTLTWPGPLPYHWGSGHRCTCCPQPPSWGSHPKTYFFSFFPLSVYYFLFHHLTTKTRFLLFLLPHPASLFSSLLPSPSFPSSHHVIRSPFRLSSPYHFNWAQKCPSFLPWCPPQAAFCNERNPPASGCLLPIALPLKELLESPEATGLGCEARCVLFSPRFLTFSNGSFTRQEFFSAPSLLVTERQGSATECKSSGPCYVFLLHSVSFGDNATLFHFVFLHSWQHT